MFLASSGAILLPDCVLLIALTCAHLTVIARVRLCKEPFGAFLLGAHLGVYTIVVCTSNGVIVHVIPVRCPL